MSKNPRTELNLHTKASCMDSVISAEDIVELAERSEYAAVAVTDLNSVRMFPAVYELAKERHVTNKIIYGAEIKCRFDNEEQETLLTLLVKNRAGLKNLYRIISETEGDGLSRYDLVAAHREGLLIGYTGDNRYTGKIPDICDYIELRPASGKQAEIKLKLSLAHQKSIPAVAVSGARYMEKADGFYRDILLASTAEAVNDDSYFELYVRDTDEMLAEFAFLGDAHELVISNPAGISGQIEHIIPIPEEQHWFEVPNALEGLKKLCHENARIKYGLPLPATVRYRLYKEFSLITRNDCASYYMLWHKLLTLAKNEGFYVTVRAAAGSSFVAYLSGISEINPLPPHYLCPSCKHMEIENVESGYDLPERICPQCGTKMLTDGHDIPYEAFMGADGEKAPDIQVSASAKACERLMEYLVSIFGSERIVGTEYPAQITWAAAYRLVKRFSLAHDCSYTKEETERIADKLCGICKPEPASLSCFTAILPEGGDIYDFTPVKVCGERGYAKTVSHFSHRWLRDTLPMVTVISPHKYNTMMELLQEFTGANAVDVPINATEAMELFESTIGNAEYGALGLPEATFFVYNLVKNTKAKGFSDLVKVIGMSHGTDVWIGNGKELIGSGKQLKELAACSEDVMQTLTEYGMERERAFYICEAVRKGELEDNVDMQEEMRKCGVPEWYINSCKKIRYLFPKAHGLDYALSYVRMAWYKLHCPAEFYAAYFSVYGCGIRDFEVLLGGADRLRQYLEEIKDECDSERYTAALLCLECAAKGIRFLEADPQRSDMRLFLAEDGNVRLPLRKNEG